MTTRKTPEQKLVAAAAADIVAHGWPAFSLTRTARKASIPLATLYEICPSKTALLTLMGKEVDLAFLRQDHVIDPEMPARDRAFDAILLWFEQLETLKPVLQAIRDAGKDDPGGDLPSPEASAFSWLTHCRCGSPMNATWRARWRISIAGCA